MDAVSPRHLTQALDAQKIYLHKVSNRNNLMMKIEKAKPSNHLVLSELTKRSKAFWGYSQKQIEEWDEQLTVSEKYIIENEVYTLEGEKKIIGYYSFYPIDEKKVKLDNIFILPEFIRKKYGSYLMTDFLSRVKKSGFSVVTLNSDPNSVNFYEKMGFEEIGQQKTSIANRFMPIMEKIL